MAGSPERHAPGDHRSAESADTDGGPDRVSEPNAVIDPDPRVSDEEKRPR
ncbi:hypothetical protein [Streptomyces sp. ST2-7A]|nr:hypothetical protein [Streptomyces sp. ST2-7A]MCE7080073.1 hypothetical protein [Streptomyces sp. ST2-7A]